MARILLMDDDADFRALLGMALSDAGHEVAYARDGQHGVDLYQDAQHEVVIVDLIMPVKNGLLAIQDLKKLAPDVKIIAFTAGERAELERAKEYGALRTIAKPFELDEMLQLVDECLNEHRGWEGVTW